MLSLIEPTQWNVVHIALQGAQVAGLLVLLLRVLLMAFQYPMLRDSGWRQSMQGLGLVSLVLALTLSRQFLVYAGSIMSVLVWLEAIGLLAGLALLTSGLYRWTLHIGQQLGFYLRVDRVRP